MPVLTTPGAIEGPRGRIPLRVTSPGGLPPAVVFLHGLGVSKETHDKEARSLAEAGFAAVLPDAVHHGERRSALLDDMARAKGLEADRILVRLVTEATEELPALVDALLSRGHPSVALGGISMGAYMALAGATVEPRLSAVVSILGSPDWTPRDGHVPDDLRDAVARAPMHQLANFPPRPLLLVNAGRDVNVRPEPARRFADALRPLYAAFPERLVHREFPESDHFMRESDWNEGWALTLDFLSRAIHR